MHRQEQLAEWESSRKSEVLIDLWVHWSRSMPGLVLIPVAWGIAEAWRWPLWVRPGIAFAAGIYVTSSVMIRLRGWCACIERRLTEIEARILSTSPSYYTRGDLEPFDRNPLFERLDAIEKQLDELRRGHCLAGCGKNPDSENGHLSPLDVVCKPRILLRRFLQSSIDLAVLGERRFSPHPASEGTPPSVRPSSHRALTRSSSPSRNFRSGPRG